MEQHKHSQGKSVTTSVPAFSFRFRTEGEELEEVCPSSGETDEDADKQEEESDGTEVAAATTSLTAVTTSTSATTSTIHSQDPSPMKECLKGFGKRSTSVDGGMIEGGLSASGSETWRLFHEIKGKIAKTVEEKFGEKKIDRRSNASVFSGGSNIRSSWRIGGGGSKDDSSINSDSEDISECSHKSQELKSARRKDREEDSPKKTTDRDKKDDDSVTSPSVDASSKSCSQEIDGNLSAPATPRKRKKGTTGTTLSVQQNRKSDKVTADSDSIPLDDMNHCVEEEVESGIEANEEMNLSSVERDEPDIPTTDYRQPFPVTCPPLNAKLRRKRSFIFRFRYWGRKLLPLIVILIYFLIPLSPYISGFLNGILVSVGVGAVYAWIVRLKKPMKLHELGGSDIQSGNKFSFPDYTKMPILEIPAVKEYHQIMKYQGWMNEYRHKYSPETYHLSDTESVYVRLEGTTLRISHTKLRIPKRAMWNERRHKLKFYHQRIYSIEHCFLKLLPEGLTRRRLWSKKYPICIILNHNANVRFEDILERNERQKGGELSPKSPSSVPDEILDEFPENLSSQHSKSEAGPEDDDDDDDDDDTYNQVPEVRDVNDSSDMPVEESDDETFCHIDKYEVMEDCLYLFARTDREKEDWYRRFAAVIRQKHSPESNEEDYVPVIPDLSSPSVVSPAASDDNLSELSSDTHCFPPSCLQAGHTFTLSTNDYMAMKSFEARDLEYLSFMSKFQQVLPYKMRSYKEKSLCSAFAHVHLHSTPPKTEAARKRQDKLDAAMETEMNKEVSADVMWINAMIGRVLFDILKNPFLVEKLQERLQKKLSTIKLPYFIEDLSITELDLGHSVPVAHRASHPKLDERGLWVDLDVTYEGTICFTLETKLNLMKVKQIGGEITAATVAEKEEVSQVGKSKSPMYDSDLDDSAESSDDEDNDGKSTSGEDNLSSKSKASQHGNLFGAIPLDLTGLKMTPPAALTGKKLMNVVSKIAASKYFQQATENKYIKKAIEGMSNTRLVLTVEVNGLVGTLVLNIPPPPSDRLWYGFRDNPRLWLQARPKLGERQVNINQVTSWIEKQLCQEFQKKFVLPNMDDIVIPLMTSQLPH